jgi:hypothetical protein
MAAQQDQTRWYSVRCLFQSPQDAGFSYEERVTLWIAGSFDQAMELAEAEALRYAADVSDETSRTEYVGPAQSYWVADDPGHGAEVFSVIRDSELAADDYVARFLSTGGEHQQIG